MSAADGETSALATWTAALQSAGDRDAILAALRANATLVEQLTSERWLVMRSARQAGASWEQIGEALGMSRQSAWEYLTRRLERSDPPADI